MGRELLQAIAQYLANETGKLSSLSSGVIRSIELLKERRTTLISASATSKIDVY